MIIRHYARRLICSLALMAAMLGMPAWPVLAQTAAAPVPPGSVATITVFAAASLTDAFKELGRNYELYNPGVKVVFNFAGSQILSQQINQGAPADVFASANSAQMNVASRVGASALRRFLCATASW